MKIPKKPPVVNNTLERLSQFSNEKRIKFWELLRDVGNTHDYQHWDTYRFKSPDNGFSAEENWAAIKFSRTTLQKPLPFYPKSTQDLFFTYARPDCVLSKLRKIDLRSGGTVATGEEQIGKEDGQKFLTRSVIEEPFSSSILEGAATTRVKAKAMIDDDVKPDTVDDRMVINNYHAMAFIKEKIHEPLTPEIILQCHEIITEGTLERDNMAGKLRDNNNVVVGDDFGEVFHSPPDYLELRDRLKRLCDFANLPEDESYPYIHPIIRAITLHFILAYDHPFVDGNGRTARALFYWSVLKSGYWMMEYLSISKIIKEAPSKYGRAFLYTETDDFDVTYFIIHQLDIIEKAISELEQYLEEKKSDYRRDEVLFENRSINHRQKDILKSMLRSKVKETSITAHMRNHKKSYVTSRKDLEDLYDQEWLFKSFRGKKAFYTPGRELKKLMGGQR